MKLPSIPTNAKACAAHCGRWVLRGACPVCEKCWLIAPAELREAWAASQRGPGGSLEAAQAAAARLAAFFGQPTLIRQRAVQPPCTVPAMPVPACKASAEVTAIFDDLRQLRRRKSSEP